MYIIDKRIIDICQHIELNIDDQLKNAARLFLVDL